MAKNAGSFVKGDPRAGRLPGTKNKVTQSMREAWSEAFEQLGGVKALAFWGKKNRTAFYQLASKLIPIEIDGKNAVTGEITITHRILNSRADLKDADA